ncbi:MAG: FlgD immunoglobulin-like domain containing protein [bacterium]
MKTRKEFLVSVAISLVVLLLAISPVFSGGPLIIFDITTRTPFAWSTGSPVGVFTDLGPMGPLTNAEADILTIVGFSEWSGVATSSFSAAIAGDFSVLGLPDINSPGTAGLVIGAFNGGGIQVVYDTNGSIISGFFGAPPGVLGIASPEAANFATGEIIEAWAVLNGATVDPGDFPPTVSFPGATFAGVFTHEFGHAINLAHTQTNGAAGFFGDDIGPTGCPTAGLPYGGTLSFSDLETMYPFLDPTAGSVGADQATINVLDDVASISNIYPGPGWPGSFGTITGKIFLSDGSSEVTGVNVIARNVADPFEDAISALSGDFTQGFGGPDGLYTFNGLTPGADYVVYIDKIVAGGFSTFPASVPFEEFWNDASESSDPTVDDQCDFVAISALGGSAVTADIIFNSSGILSLGDDDFARVSLPFEFPFCGTSYSSVFVSSNGFLTFRTGSPDPSPSVAEGLIGPPGIAPLWLDLSPDLAGTVTAEPVGPDFVVTFFEVPEFPLTGPPLNSNTFSVTLRPDGSFNFDYGVVEADGGLVGRSPGLGFATDPGEVDLSAASEPITGALGDAVYELFDAADFDLSEDNLEWAPCLDLMIAIAAAVPGKCYASTGFADGGNLLTIDPATGAGTLIGPTGVPAMSGLAINSRGEIFGTDPFLSAGLYRVDANTGAATILNNIGLFGVDAIAFDENDVLYAIDSFNSLHTVDPATGATSFMGNTGAPIRGMAFDPTDGTLWGSAGAGVDAIFTIDKTTGAATFVGATGLGGSTPDIHFDAAGNLFGSKGGGFFSGGNNALISIDKATGAGTVIGPIGFRAVSGLASFSHGFVLFANEDVEIDGQVDSEGNIHSNEDIEFGRGNPSTHTGDLTAVDDIEIARRNTITGNATAGDDVENSGTISGVIEENAVVVAIPLPTFSFSVGVDDIEVPRDGSLTLAPGSYGEVEVEDRGSLSLSSGEYFVDELELEHSAILSIDVSNGPVTINIARELEFERSAEVRIVPANARTNLVTYNQLGPKTVKIGKSATVLGTINAPQAKVKLKQASRFKGSICAKEINVKKKASFRHHTSTTPFPAPLLLTGNVGDDASGSAKLPIEYQLGENYPNPFNPETAIRFHLPEASRVVIRIFNTLGQEIKSLVDGEYAAGIHTAVWDGKDKNGVQVSSGVYLYRIQTDKFAQVKKMTLLR